MYVFALNGWLCLSPTVSSVDDERCRPHLYVLAIKLVLTIQRDRDGLIIEPNKRCEVTQEGV